MVIDKLMRSFIFFVVVLTGFGLGVQSQIVQGQIVQAQPVQVQIVQAQKLNWQVLHPRTIKPGDAATVRVLGAKTKPSVFWNDAALVLSQDGDAWIGVGRELLGTTPKNISVRVIANGQEQRSAVRLLPSGVRPEEVLMSAQVLAALTDANRARERGVLESAYQRSLYSPRAFTKTWRLPMNSATTSAFGQARYYEKGGEVSYHYGQDFRGAVGAPVRAANDGTVLISGFYKIRGGLIAIDHGAGVVSLYFHQSKLLRRVGEHVMRGEVIGLVGATGFVTGPHLHWEMRVLGESTNPMQWVGKVWP